MINAEMSTLQGLSDHVCAGEEGKGEKRGDWEGAGERGTLSQTWKKAVVQESLLRNFLLLLILSNFISKLQVQRMVGQS